MEVNKQVKKLILTILAVIAILAMSAPAMADTVDTQVQVGQDGTAPYMIAVTMTPDNTVATGVQVDPEFAIPNAGGTFTGLNAASDGWKLVKFYVEVGHQNGISNIDNVAIDVLYPASFNAEDAALFGARAGLLKFEINVNRVSESGWTSQITYPYPGTYPDSTNATVPALAVRELVYNTPSDIVDVNADNVLGNDSDKNWHDFLTYWGTDRINYGSGFDAVTAFDKYQFNPSQALVLEICGWMWFHQPGVKYTVEAKAATLAGATSPVLNDGGKFLNYNRVVGLYTDFDTVNYGSVNVGGVSWAAGDRFLTTPTQTTVWNNGNASAQLLVSSTKMVKHIAGDTGWDWAAGATNIQNSLYYNSAAKTVVTFDAELYYANGAGQTIQYGTIVYLADTPATVITVNGTNPVLLQSCRPAKIQFSVHPELGEGQEAGAYSGFLTVSVAPYTGTQLPTP